MKLVKKLIFISLMILLGATGCSKTPPSTSDKLQDKTALESMEIIRGLAHVPYTYRSGMKLTSIDMDPVHRNTLVYNYLFPTNAPKGQENLQITQRDIYRNKKVTMSAIGACRSMYIYFKNGAKMRVLSHWKDGTIFADYIVSKKTCDKLRK
jgi:hypothetical protein